MQRLPLVLVLAAASIASADPPKRPTSVPKVELSTRVKPPDRKAAAPATPTLSADAMMQVEVLTSPIHMEQEGMLLELIGSTPDSEVDEKAELYFRLGELYAKQHRLYHLLSIEADLKGDKSASTKATQTATTYLKKAAQAYQALTTNDAFKNFKQMDLALFVFGYTLQTGNHPTEARAVYDKLLRNYPASKYVSEAHFAFAEYYFEAGQLEDAEARYKLVLKSPKSSVYWYAMYKLGWIELNRHRPEDALETFYKVVQGTVRDRERATLYASAKKDFVRAYAEIGKVDKALVAFKRVDAAGALAMYETLADLYRDQGKSDKAIFAYRDLMKLQPKSAHACRWEYEVSLAMLALPGATLSDRVGEIDNLAKVYRAVRTTKLLPAADLGECRDNAAAMSGELARAYHAEYAKTFSAETFAAARRLYSTYLTTFPDAPDAPNTRFFHADLLWARAERETDARVKTQAWEDAALAFIDVVKAGGLDDAKLNEAAYAGVRGLMYAHESDPRTPTLAKANDDDGKLVTPKPLPEREKRMIEAFDLYVTRTKSPPVGELVQMKFMKANVLRRFDHLDEAEPLFQELVTKYPKTPEAIEAGLLLVDIYIRQNNERSLVALANQLLGNQTLVEDQPDVAKKLRDILRVGQRRAAEQMEKAAAGKHDLALYVQCGQAYLEIYNLDPEHEDNAEVLYNAGVCFEEGRSLDAAIKMFETLQQFYPSSPEAAHGAARLGKVFGDIAKYADAATKLETYAKKYGKEADAFQAMSEAVFFFKGIGNDAKAIDGTRYVVKMWGKDKPAEAAEAAYGLIPIFEKQADSKALIKHLREYIAKHGTAGGPARLVVAYSKLGEALMRTSCPITETEGLCAKVTRERAVATRRTKSTGPRLTCGDPSNIKLQLVTRDARLVKDARTAFAGAAKTFATLTGDAARDPIARHFAAHARFVEATIDFEAVLALPFPANLDFDKRSPAVAAKSIKRFDTWFNARVEASTRAAERYSNVAELRDNASSIAAAARLGQIHQTFADALYTAEIPRDVRTGAFAEDKTETYCDALTEKAEPLAKRALASYGTCLGESTKLGWFSEWSQLCERELGQIRPDEFPTASERRSDADRLALVIASEAPPRLD